MSEKKDVSFEIYSDSEKMLEQIVDKYDLPDQSKALRKNFAGVGGTYDPVRDAFYAPKKFNSWILNESTCLWEAPVALPSDGKEYEWNETTKAWDEIT